MHAVLMNALLVTSTTVTTYQRDNSDAHVVVVADLGLGELLPLTDIQQEQPQPYKPLHTHHPLLGKKGNSDIQSIS